MRCSGPVTAAVLVLGLGSADLASASEPASQLGAAGLFFSLHWQHVVASDPEYRVGILAPQKVAEDQGVEGGLLIGWRFANGWDVTGSLTFADFMAGRPVTAFNGRDSADYIVTDANIGYTIRRLKDSLRLGIGVRVADFEHRYRENVAGMSEEFTGAGPRVAGDWTRTISGPWIFAAGVGGGPLFGDVSAKPMGGVFPVPSGNRTVWNLDGYAGIGYQVGATSILVGWRGELWSGLHSSQFGLAGGDEDRVAHGPFMRFSYGLSTAGR